MFLSKLVPTKFFSSKFLPGLQAYEGLAETLQTHAAANGTTLLEERVPQIAHLFAVLVSLSQK